MSSKTWWMISGSMSFEGNNIVEEFVYAQIKKGMDKALFLFGDNHLGVDWFALKACVELGADFAVSHIQGEKARSLRRLAGETKIKSAGKAEDYAGRDWEMAFRSEKGIFIWDGRSKGTKAAMDTMKEMGKEHYIVTLQSGKLTVRAVTATNV